MKTDPWKSCDINRSLFLISWSIEEFELTLWLAWRLHVVLRVTAALLGKRLSVCSVSPAPCVLRLPVFFQGAYKRRHAAWHYRPHRRLCKRTIWCNRKQSETAVKWTKVHNTCQWSCTEGTIHAAVIPHLLPYNFCWLHFTLKQFFVE